MENNIINGTEMANRILDEIKSEMKEYTEYNKPVIIIIQIGEREDSSIYIKKKIESCRKIGFDIGISNFEIDIKQENICKYILDLNNNSEIHGILVQLPIPVHLNEEEILSKIDYHKDIDGFHAQNMGNLAMNNRTPMFIPCTPLGCMEILKREKIELVGKHVVIVGKSNIVGLPLALLLMKEMATVTVCHKETVDIVSHLKMADIVISACGCPQMIKKDWLKPGVVVIDVGINVIPDSTKKSGYRLVGDVDFDNVKDIASKITPVPGGVGPMTVAMLMMNAFKSFKHSKGRIPLQTH
jgi:methylenetetrahydrofolate dehydrogenase (NADP+)/methenyltetrahydrofolate cyclohydrolase/formyltetrahydrofolate synthetase